MVDGSRKHFEITVRPRNAFLLTISCQKTISVTGKPRNMYVYLPGGLSKSHYIRRRVKGQKWYC